MLVLVFHTVLLCVVCVSVRLGRSVDGRVKITHLCDGFIKNFKKHFPVGKLVRAKVLE